MTKTAAVEITFPFSHYHIISESASTKNAIWRMFLMKSFFSTRSLHVHERRLWWRTWRDWVLQAWDMPARVQRRQLRPQSKTLQRKPSPHVSRACGVHRGVTWNLQVCDDNLMLMEVGRWRFGINNSLLFSMTASSQLLRFCVCFLVEVLRFPMTMWCLWKSSG